MIIKTKFLKKYKSGYPLLVKEALENPVHIPEEGTIIDFTDFRGNFICRGYIGLQNKGIGWMLTTDCSYQIDSDFFNRKLKESVCFRKDFYRNKDTDCFRVFNGEGDGIGGITVDNYAGFYLINWYNKGIYKFNEEIISALESCCEVKGIYQKKRFESTKQITENDSFVKGTLAPSPLLVIENNVNFSIYLEDGAMVGVFLDQREVRQKIRHDFSSNKAVLNTFSYTGAFSIFAALGKAKTTVSVDLAKRSLPKTKEHFEINNINPGNNKIIVEDIFNYFKYAKRKNLKFDLVILDPPGFAQSKKFKFSSARDYPFLLKEAIEITSKHAVIVASTNNSKFDMEKFKSFVLKAFVGDTSKFRILEEFRLPKDFRTNPNFQEGNYLKVLFIQIT
jgi:23S rRNA (cytosine1962-C5)-methyltransferase